MSHQSQPHSLLSRHPAVAPATAKARDGSIPLPLRNATPPPRRNFVMVERLIQIWIANQQSLDRLRALRLRERRIRAYAASEGSSKLLSQALGDRVRVEICSTCARLGANDREARRLLRELSRPRGTWKVAVGSGHQQELRQRRSG